MKSPDVVEKLNRLKDPNLSQSAKKSIVRGLLIASQHRRSSKERLQILHFFKVFGKNLSAEFIPVIAALNYNLSLREQHAEFIQILESGAVLINGVKIPVLKWFENHGFDNGNRLIWALCGQWFNKNSFPDPSSTLLMDFLFYQCDEDISAIIKQKNQILEKVGPTFKNPNWQFEIIDGIEPSMIPVLFRFCCISTRVSVQLASAILKHAPRNPLLHPEWDNLIHNLATDCSDIEIIRMIWARHPTLDMAHRIVSNPLCSPEDLLEILRSHGSKTKYEDPNSGVKDSLASIIDTWFLNHKRFSIKGWVELLNGAPISTHLYRMIIQSQIRREQTLKHIYHRINRVRVKRILNDKLLMMRCLRESRLNDNAPGIRDLFIREYDPRSVIELVKASLKKIKYFNEGKVISKFGPECANANKSNRKLTRRDVFTVLLALITRNNQSFIKEGKLALGDPDLIQRARDSLSFERRFRLYQWLTDTVVEGKSLWEWKDNPSSLASKLVLDKLLSDCNSFKPILEILNRLLDMQRDNGFLSLTVGGCSLNNLNVKSKDVGCCYFYDGSEQNSLMPWLISRNHIFLYINFTSNRKSKPIGVVMLFFADSRKTLVIDSVEGKYYELNAFNGWEKWLWRAINDYGRSMGVKRIILNKDVMGDIAGQFVRWVENNQVHVKDKKPVELSAFSKNVLMEFDPKTKNSFNSYLKMTFLKKVKS